MFVLEIFHSGIVEQAFVILHLQILGYQLGLENLIGHNFRVLSLRLIK